jgi:nicotinamidase-related amidase
VTVAKKMSHVAQILNIPLVVTEHDSEKYGHTAVDAALQKAILIREKNQFSMMITEVREFLERNNIESVVLYGLETHICILQTALDLLEEQYNVHIPVDGVSAHNYTEHRVALKHLGRVGAALVTSETLLFQLLNVSDSPEYSAIYPLIQPWRDADAENYLYSASPKPPNS